jgi:hypothetical protein
MTTTTAPIYRSFTVDESSAIAHIEIDTNLVEIIFQSNTEQAYAFDGSDAFVEQLTDVISYTDLKGISLGSMIAKARKSGDLQQLTVIEI